MVDITSENAYPWKLWRISGIANAATHVSYHRTRRDALAEARTMTGYRFKLEKYQNGGYDEKPLHGLYKKGGQPGNSNAVKPGRTRIKLDVSLSGKRLAFFEQLASDEIYSKTEERRTPTDEEITQEARHMFYQWIDSLLS